MARKKQNPAPAIDTEAAAPKAPKPPSVSPFGKVNPVHRLDGAADYLRLLANRTSAVERRLPDPADALSENEASRREHTRTTMRRHARALSNAAGLVQQRFRHVHRAVNWVDTLLTVSKELQAKLEQEKLQPTGVLHERRVYALREALTYIDFMACPQCKELLDESQPVIVDPATALRPGTTPPPAPGTAEQAYAALYTPPAEPEPATGTYEVVRRHLACPHCGAMLTQARITSTSNVTALFEARPAVDWYHEQDLYSTEQWLDDTAKEVDSIIATVHKSIMFAEGLESAKPGADPDEVTEPTPTLEQQRAAALASV